MEKKIRWKIISFSAVSMTKVLKVKISQKDINHNFFHNFWKLNIGNLWKWKLYVNNIDKGLEWI